MLTWHLRIFSREGSVRVWARFFIGLFVSLLFSFKISLCVLDSGSFSDVSFTSILSQSVASSLFL